MFLETKYTKMDEEAKPIPKISKIQMKLSYLDEIIVNEWM